MAPDRIDLVFLFSSLIPCVVTSTPTLLLLVIKSSYGIPTLNELSHSANNCSIVSSVAPFSDA